MALKALPDWNEEDTKARLAKEEAALNKNLKNNSPATVAWVTRQLNYLTGEVVDYLMDLRKAVADLEAKTALLEEKSLSYEGVFSKSQQYNPGALVTHRSGLWYCKSATRSAPGTSSDWQLTGKTPLARGGKQ